MSLVASFIKCFLNPFLEEFFKSCLLKNFFQVPTSLLLPSRHLPPLNFSSKDSDCKPAATWRGTEESSPLLFSSHKTFCIYMQTTHYSMKWNKETDIDCFIPVSTWHFLSQNTFHINTAWDRACLAAFSDRYSQLRNVC